MNIHRELRKQLLAFLQKTLEQSYITVEWENYATSHFQNSELEDIRIKMVEAIISFSPMREKKPLNDEIKMTIRELIDELEQTAS